MLLKLSQVDDAHKDTYDDVLRCDVPTDTVPCNDKHTSDAANQNADNPAVRTNLGINIDRQNSCGWDLVYCVTQFFD